MFLNYFGYLGSETYDATNPTLEIVIVTNNYNNYVYNILDLLVKSAQKQELCTRGLQKFKSKIQSTTRHFSHDGQKHQERSKSDIIKNHLTSLGRTASRESCFVYDDSDRERTWLSNSRIDITIGDENAFSNQLPTINDLIQNGLAGTSEDSLSDDSTNRGREFKHTNPHEGPDGTTPSETSRLISNNEATTSSPSSSSTWASAFKKRETELIALGMFGSFSSLGILAYLQYHGPDGKSFLDGLKDIPNNTLTLTLAIVGGVCIVALIATAVAACRSESDNPVTPTGHPLGRRQ